MVCYIIELFLPPIGSVKMTFCLIPLHYLPPPPQLTPFPHPFLPHPSPPPLLGDFMNILQLCLTEIMHMRL